MSLKPYSSVSAFVAHYRALRASGEEGCSGEAAAPSLAGEAQQALAESERLLEELSEAERAALGLAQSGIAGSEGRPAAAGLPSDPASRR
ncbi:MAG TPA: hypothetical protein VHY56_06400, partial [Candidatus Binataceae bacterium]|nr:hypothetical protein [Candidatus Binataceae bacterium]